MDNARYPMAKAIPCRTRPRQRTGSGSRRARNESQRGTDIGHIDDFGPVLDERLSSNGPVLGCVTSGERQIHDGKSVAKRGLKCQRPEFGLRLRGTVQDRGAADDDRDAPIVGERAR